MMSPLRAWIGFSAMALGMFLAILDIQVVASSLVDIQTDLAIPTDRLSYLQTTYLIAEVIAIAASGYLARALSLRWLFTGGLIGFVLASLACAASPDYPTLYVARFVQGLFGGVLIPTVFSATLQLFPPARQGLATAIGGGFATLAPTLGPFVGGWITESLSWHWLFLINVIPGLIAALTVAMCIRGRTAESYLLRQIDWLSLALATAALSTLELLLKEAPRMGWLSGEALGLAGICVVTGLLTVRRCGARDMPLFALKVFADPQFAASSAYSFILGFALYGATYLLPLYLGLVRVYGPREIGTIMMVTGAAQLAASPLAVYCERRMDLRWMTALGYALFAAGLLLNGFGTPRWDFRELTAPQILRGSALLFCLLPTTRLALGRLAPAVLPQGSSQFNLMRNIGGAVGLALIDTVLSQRPAVHAAALVAKLQAGDRATAAFVGLPLARFHGQPLGAVDEATRQFAEPLVKAAALTMSFNDAWLLLGGLSLVAALAVPFMPFARRVPDSPPADVPSAPLY